jgi:hypothetical protein
MGFGMTSPLNITNREIPQGIMMNRNHDLTIANYEQEVKTKGEGKYKL